MSPTRPHRLRIAALCATCLLVAGYVEAQQSQQPTAQRQYGQQNARRTAEGAQQRDQNLINGRQHTTNYRGSDATGAAATSATQEVDNYLANCWQAKNDAAIKLNEFAQQRAQNPQVKQFAEQVVQDHRQLAQRLSQLTSSRATTSTQGTQAAMAGNNAALNQLLQIDRQITDKCVSMAEEKLGEKSGAEFDKCYVTSQIGGHMQMLAALDVISQQTNGQLQQTARDAKTTVEQHLQRAEQLMKQLESNAGSQANRQARN
jgi:putative membrane protein